MRVIMLLFSHEPPTTLNSNAEEIDEQPQECDAVGVVCVLWQWEPVVADGAQPAPKPRRLPAIN